METLGFEGIQEVNQGHDYIDILFQVERHKFVLELKIDRRGTNDGVTES
ncbi:MAG: hypothetical protein M1368_07600 [Thaumarchaeota archaeon]|nr:hypothetical protein [Nitrososphaerota archaeon]